MFKIEEDETAFFVVDENGNDVAAFNEYEDAERFVAQAIRNQQ